MRGGRVRKRRAVVVVAALVLFLGGYWSIHRFWLVSHPSIPLSESIRRGDLAAVDTPAPRNASTALGSGAGLSSSQAPVCRISSEREGP